MRSRSLIFLAILLAVTLVSFALLLPETFAQYNPTGGIAGAENIGCSGADCQACNLVRLGNNVISFLIYAGTVVAALLFAYAGIKSIVSGDDSGALTEARKIFWDVIKGFVIMLAAWLLVDTALKTLLSSDYTKFGPWNKVICTTRDVDVLIPYPTPPPTTTRGSERCARDAVRAAGIGINKDPCPSAGSLNCTDLGGLPKQAVESLIGFKNSCTNCGPIIITGGSETGPHATHGPGKAIIDIDDSPRIISYLENNGSKSFNRRGEAVYRLGNGSFTYEKSPTHLHIVFNVASNEPYTCSI